MKKIISTKDAPEAIGPYSQAVKAGSFVFVSGQLGIDPVTSEFVSNDAGVQTMQALNNIKSILSKAGSSLEKIVKVTIYMANINDYSEINKIYSTFFTRNYPAREAVEVSGLPKNAKVEISVMAEI